MDTNDKIQKLIDNEYINLSAKQYFGRPTYIFYKQYQTTRIGFDGNHWSIIDKFLDDQVICTVIVEEVINEILDTLINNARNDIVMLDNKSFKYPIAREKDRLYDKIRTLEEIKNA